MKLKLTKRSKLMIAYFASMLGLLLLNIILNVVPNTLSDNSIDTLYTIVSQIFCMGILPLTISILLLNNKGESFKSTFSTFLTDCGYKTKLSVKQILWLIPLAISFYLVTKLMSSITVLFLMLTGYQFPLSSSTIYSGPLDLIKWIVLGGLLPAVFEEFTHRGLLVNALKDRGSEVGTVVLSGLLFALMHTNIMQFFYAFIGGCIFGYIAVRSKSIIPGMVMHFLNNTFSYIEDYASQHPQCAIGFLNEITHFWSTNIVTLLLRAVILVANLFLFVLLLNQFIKNCAERNAIKPYSIPKTKLDIDCYCPNGRATLVDNFVMYGVIAMCALSTVFTYIWGLLR